LDEWKSAFQGNWSQQQANNNGVEFAGFFDGKHPWKTPSFKQ